MAFLLLISVTVIFSTALVQALVVLLTLLVLFRFVFDRSFVFRRTPLDLPFLAFIAARVISVFFSRDIATSLPALYIEFFFYFVFFLVTQSIRRDEMSAARFLSAALVAAGVVAGLVGTFKVLSGMELRPLAVGI